MCTTVRGELGERKKKLINARMYDHERGIVNSMQTDRVSDNSSCSRFSTGVGCEEHFVLIRTRPGICCSDAIEELSREYSAALETEGLSDATVVFSRLFAGDYVNQRETVNDSALLKRLRLGALSIVEQNPVGGGQFSLFSYHIRRRACATFVKQISNKFPDCRNTIMASLENYRLLFTANYVHEEGPDAYSQTTEIFNALNASLERSGMNLPANGIRTWIFMRDIDKNYTDMVRARKDFFASHGLTNKTRYLASTGIEGAGVSLAHFVTVDSLSIGGLGKGQIIRMEAPSHLSPTILYNVTFERGLKVRFGDRSHLYISGTASINNKGEVVHVGDVEMQARRTIENLRALLAEHSASISDMAYLLVYIRNFHDWELIRGVLHETIGTTIPVISVQAKVCRPAWLFELEGMAVIPDNADFLPFG
jgi:enamine deaminase RidA (YjgF/YER057c/UK114 family)